MALGNVEVAEAQNALNTKRAGAYTHAVNAGRLAKGDAEKFSKAAEGLFDDIRANKKTKAYADGIAVAIGAEMGKPKKGESVAPYKVPSALRTARSVINDALERGVNLEDDDGARAFTAIRSDCKTLRDAENEAALTGDAKVRHMIVQDLEAIKSRVQKAEGDNLEALRKILKTALVDVREAFGIDAERAQKKAAKEAAEAEAEELADAA